ncbi:MAG TPA: twin-arginine translocase TatA/TatE family subunit [Candidatus Phocaeicola gallistercoris]|jgi:sec-independent protein translocase protein TatA|nr:twin-arginine translocase TatA/TatE family subunit [Candidatus Phocaeicola gallistercoris]
METFLFLGSLGTSEILLIVFIVLLLFGGRKIPELMRGLGKGIRNFKEGMNGVEKDADVANQSSGSTDVEKK